MNGEETKDKPAGVIRRSMAFLIDLSIGVMGPAIAIVLMGLLIPLDSQWMWIVVVPIVGLGFIYLIWAPALFGHSVGRYLVGIRLICFNHGDRPTGGQCVTRMWSLVLWPVDLLMIALSKTRRRLGDRWAGTQVVLDRRNPVSLAKRIAIGLCIVVGGYLFVDWTASLAAKNTRIYKVAVRFIRREGIGTSEYGTPVRLEGGPFRMAFDRERGDVVVRASWPKRTAFIAVHCRREKGKWVIQDFRIVDQPDSIQEYVFHY